MANLVLLSNSSIINNKKSGQIIKSEKFLPAPKEIYKRKILNQSSFESPNKKERFLSENILIRIERKVIKIDKILKDTYALRKKEESKKYKEKERNYFTQKEKQLEKRKPKGASKFNIPSPPSIGIFDWIRNFVLNTFLGFLAFRLIDHLPKLLKILPTIASISDFVIDIGGKMLDGLITFVDKGYKAYDDTKKFVKDFGGDEALKQFEKFSGVFQGVIEAGLIFAIAASNMSGDRGGTDLNRRGGPDRGGRPKGGGRPRVTQGQGGNRQRPRVPGTRPRVTFGQGGKLPSGSAIRRGGLLGLVNLIPDILNSWDLWQNQGRGKDALRTFFSAVAGVVAGLGAITAVEAGAAALGVTGVGLPAAIALAVSGFAASSIAGSAAYNISESILKRMGLIDNDPETGKPYAYKNGGLVRAKKRKVKKYARGGPVSTRGGKIIDASPKRKLSKSKKIRKVSITPKKIKPGNSVGGESKIVKIFPKSNDNKSINPLGYIQDVHKITSSIPFFGPIFSIAIKTLSGDKPTSLDYKNVASSLDYWMNTTFSSSIQRTGGKFAGGGMVDSDMFMRSEDLTQVITKSVEESITKKVDDAINELKKQLMLKSNEVENEKVSTSGQQGIEGDEDFSGSTGAEKTMHYLISQGLTGAQAAGIAGNLQQESGFDPDADNGSHHGIAQWDKQHRWPRVSAYIRSVGRDPNTLEGQLVGLKWEAEQRGDWREIKKASSARESSAIWLERFERSGEKPGMRGFENRMIYANELSSKYGNYVPRSTSGEVRIGRGSGNLSEAQKLASSMGLQLTSSQRGPRYPGDKSLHISGRAMDFSNGVDTPQQKSFAKQMIIKYGLSLAELIYTPLGFGIKDGKKVPLSTWGEKTNAAHYDHVHVAFKDGGETPGEATPAVVGEEGPEYVISHNSYKTTEKVAPGLLDILNYNVKDVASLKKYMPSIIASLSKYAPYEDGSPIIVVNRMMNNEPTIASNPSKITNSINSFLSDGVNSNVNAMTQTLAQI